MSKVKNMKKSKATAKLPDGSPEFYKKFGKKFRDQQALKCKQEKNGKISQTVKEDNWLISAAECFGTVDKNLVNYFVDQVAKTSSGITPENSAEHLNKLTPILLGINPQDELEGMLACQMVGVHNLAMEVMNRAMLADQTVAGVTENVNRATKLLRTFTAQMEALNRYRGKGQQKMTVEHVHVHQGGQAIVGNVEQRRRGDNEK